MELQGTKACVHILVFFILNKRYK